eukprot:GHVU01082004.1.p2 GENE.GHVU01082004.1~~GHVU01082004.1.p2  ORF type:complete len:182 (-),score=17.54 GHVU01082004.1:384-929(-)
MGLELHRVKQTMKPQVQQRIKPIAQHAHTHTYIRTHAYTHVDIREMREYGLECVPREIGVDDQLGAGPHCCRLPRIKHLPVATLREGTPLGAQKRVREVSIEDKLGAKTTAGEGRDMTGKSGGDSERGRRVDHKTEHTDSGDECERGAMIQVQERRERAAILNPCCCYGRVRTSTCIYIDR